MRTLLRTIILTLAWWANALVRWAWIQRQWWITRAVVHPYRTWSENIVLELQRQPRSDGGGFANQPAHSPSATSDRNAWTLVSDASGERTA